MFKNVLPFVFKCHPLSDTTRFGRLNRNKRSVNKRYNLHNAIMLFSQINAFSQHQMNSFNCLETQFILLIVYKTNCVKYLVFLVNVIQIIISITHSTNKLQLLVMSQSFLCYSFVKWAITTSSSNAIKINYVLSLSTFW